MALIRSLGFVALGLLLVGTASVSQQPTAGGSQWPTSHFQENNNAVLPSANVGAIAYRRSFPVLLNSDTPIVNGRLFVVGGNANAPGKTTAPGYVFALNAKTGHILWTQSTPNSIYAEPIISDGHVLVGVGNALFRKTQGIPSLEPGMVRGVGPSGVYAYHVNNGWPAFEFVTREADQAPATIYHGRAYVASGSRDLYVLNAASGRLLWWVNLGHYVSRSSPRIVDGLVVVGGAGPLGVVAVSLGTHHIVWQHPVVDAVGGVDDTTLAVSGNLLVGAALLKPKPGAAHGFRAVVFALNALTGDEVWLHQVALGDVPAFKETGTPLVVQHTVYVGNAFNGNVRALSLRTGRVLWTVNAGSPVTRPPAFSQGRVLFVSQHGMLEGVSTTGKVLFRKSLGSYVNTYGPVVLGNIAFVTANTPTHGVLIAQPLPS